MISKGNSCVKAWLLWAKCQSCGDDITGDAHARIVPTYSRGPALTCNTHPPSSVPRFPALEMNSGWLQIGSLATVHHEQDQTPHRYRQENNGKSVPQASVDNAQSRAGSSMAVAATGTCPHGRRPMLRRRKHRPQRPSGISRTSTVHAVLSRIWSTSNEDTRGSAVLWRPSAPGSCQPAHHLPGTRQRAPVGRQTRVSVLISRK